MNINESFPSKYLKASDVPEEGLTVVIVRVGQEEIGKDKDIRPVLYFDGEEKGIVLNKTNATNISKLYGYETEDWTGKKVQLGTAWVDFQGQSVEAIRIYPPKRSSANAPLDKSAPVAGNGTRQYDDRNPPPRDLDDDIPF